MHPAFVKRLLLADKGAEWSLPFTCSVGMHLTCMSEENVAKGLALDKADTAGHERYGIIGMPERAQSPDWETERR